MLTEHIDSEVLWDLLLPYKERLLGFFIGIEKLDNSNCLFLILNPDNKFNSLLESVRRISFYHDDKGFIDKDLHVIVLKLPSKYQNTINKFVEGKYSQLYSKSDVVKLFRTNSHQYHVLLKSKDLKEQLERDLNIKLSNDSELDDIPELVKEIYNYVE